MKLDVRQAAELLRVPVSTVERWVRQGSIPVRRGRGKPTFDRDALESWARERRLVVDRSNACAPGEACPVSDCSLCEALSTGGVHYGIPGDDPASVLARAVERLDYSPEYRETLLARLLEREELSSTGIGKGVAIPHPRSPLDGTGPDCTIITCFLEHPVPWSAIDDKPVFVLFLLICPTTRVHLQMLSRLAFCLRDDAFVGFLRAEPVPERLLEEVRRLEAGMDEQ